jgi:hypothetical protein
VIIEYFVKETNERNKQQNSFPVCIYVVVEDGTQRQHGWAEAKRKWEKRVFLHYVVRILL